MAPKRKLITSDDILGREAIDPEGEILGIVMKLHIDKDSKRILGITIDQGFMKPDIFIGTHYIKNFGVDAVFLNKVPTDKFRGLEVITPEGTTIGTVKEVVSKRHKVTEIIVAPKGISISAKKVSISATYIEEIGESVVLKKGYKIKKIDNKAS